MVTLRWILISTFLISLIAFIGAVMLFLNEKLLSKILLLLVAFSAGSMMGGAFLHLIPEAVIGVSGEADLVFQIFLYVLLGFCVFFVLEQLIKWHHHHATSHPEATPFSYLTLVSGSIHNFIDGLIIAGSFVISLPLGLVTVLAVALHEVPQEIGNYGILVYGGFKKVKALLLNFLSATAIIFGGVAGFFLSQQIGDRIIFLLPFAAGSFIYIAASDLVPEIKQGENVKKSILYLSVFLLGIGLMLLIRLL